MASMTSDEIRVVLDAHAKWLLGGGERADLHGANLRGADLRGANLREADLSGANLRGADLRGANLRGADLSWANPIGANLREADLRGADLRGADLREANLTDADLSGANLIEADLRGTGVCRIYDSGYEATLYPGTDGPELAYRCERHSLSHWEENVEQIASKHLPTEAVAAKVEQLRALFAYLRTIPQPKFSEEVSRG